jgi:succinoglycan biosynthesis transport protein ExoP
MTEEPRFVAPDRSLRHYLRVLRKHRWLMTLVFLLVAVTGAVWTFRQTPIFQAAATIMIEPEAPKILNIQEVQPVGASSPWDPSYYATQHDVIQSQPVVDKVIEQLNLRSRLPSLAETREPHREVQGWLTVEPKRGTRLVWIRAEHPDPVLAAEVANATAHAYVKYNLGLKVSGAHEALSWLTEEAARLRTKVEESSMALQNYRVKTGILGLQEQRQITAQKIMDFNKAHLDAQAQRLTIESKLQTLKDIAKDPLGAQTIYTVADNSLIGKLKTEAVDLDIEKSKLLKTYGPKHPEIQKIVARTEEVRRNLDAELKTMLDAVGTEYKVAKAREDTLANNVKNLSREGQDVSEKEIRLLSLQREVETNQQLYDSVLKRLKETGVTGSLETNNVRVVEEATAPGAPVKPRRARHVVMSLMAGLVLAVGLALGIEYFDTSLRTPDDVERELGLPVVAIIPAFEGKR